MGLFMNGHVNEVNLPVLAQLVSSELLQGLAFLEGPLWVGLGTGLARGVNLSRD